MSLIDLAEIFGSVAPTCLAHRFLSFLCGDTDSVKGILLISFSFNPMANCMQLVDRWDEKEEQWNN